MTNALSRSHLTSATSHFVVAVMIASATPAWAQNAQTPAEAQTAAAQAQAEANPEAAVAAEAAEAQAEQVGTEAARGDEPTEAAQVADAQEIVVTGIRASLESSARIKRASPTIVEVVTAEDIGKLPDVSIADSLARLPGVTAQRLEGRDQRLSIRGLGPDFGVTLLNGREQVTVGDNRGVEYDQYPAEFFKNVIVNKSANAALVPAGIAGTVDLRLLRPLSERERIVAVQVRGQYNSLKKLNPEGERVGYRASGMYVDQFNGDTLGVAIGVSHTKTVGQNERYHAWGYPNSGSTGGNLLIGGAKPFVQSNILERTGVVGTLEFKPSDRMHTTFDVLYSKFKETQYLRGIEFPIAPDWGGGTVDSFTAEDGFVTGAVVSNIVGVIRNDYNRRKADNLSLGINNVFALTGTMNLTVDGSWSKADRTDFVLENYSGTGFALSGAKDTITLSQDDDGTFDINTTIDYSDPANFVITDPRGWGWNGTEAVVQAGFLNEPKFEDDLKALRASLDGQIGGGFLSRWEVGGVYSRRSKDANFTSAWLCPKDNDPGCSVAGGVTQLAIPQAAVVGTVPLGYIGIPAMYALDPLYLFNNIYEMEVDQNPVSLARDYNVTEKVLTGYAMVNIDTDLGAVPLAGNVGVQVVRTDQSSTGFVSRVDAGVVTRAEADDGDRYTHVLPSMALSFQVQRSTFLKLGASRTLIRPRMDQERVTSIINLNFQNIDTTDPELRPFFTASGGNARLRPYTSFNLDGSLEHYFPKGGYVALALYRKKLSDFVDPNRTFLFDFAEYASTLPQDIQNQLNTTMGTVSGPANDGKGRIFGQELTLSLPFANLTRALDGFGFFGSVARVSSKVKYASQPGAIDIPGLSKWVGTAEGYFEKYGFQARLSYRYRSKFIGEVAGISAQPIFRTAKAEGILDAQLGYEFQPGSRLHGLTIIGQAKNLTDRPFVTYEADDTRRVIDHQRYGRDFYLTAAYKF